MEAGEEAESRSEGEGRQLYAGLAIGLTASGVILISLAD